RNGTLRHANPVEERTAVGGRAVVERRGVRLAGEIRSDGGKRRNGGKPGRAFEPITLADDAGPTHGQSAAAARRREEAQRRGGVRGNRPRPPFLPVVMPVAVVVR